jgi:hypothetical protein
MHLSQNSNKSIQAVNWLDLIQVCHMTCSTVDTNVNKSSDIFRVWLEGLVREIYTGLS